GRRWRRGSWRRLGILARRQWSCGVKNDWVGWIAVRNRGSFGGAVGLKAQPTLVDCVEEDVEADPRGVLAGVAFALRGGAFERAAEVVRREDDHVAAIDRHRFELRGLF